MSTEPDTSSGRYRFRRQSRLARQRDFERVWAARCSVADSWLVVYAAENSLNRPRVGLVASRKVGGAVVRNRIRRLLREAFRHQQADLPVGFDYLVIPRTGRRASLAQYRESLLKLARQAADKWGRLAGRSGQEPAQPDG